MWLYYSDGRGGTNGFNQLIVYFTEMPADVNCCQIYLDLHCLGSIAFYLI